MRDKFDVSTGKRVAKGLKESTIKFRDKNLKEVNNWISGKDRYSSPLVNNSWESTLKRLGRAENNKISDPEFQKTLMGL
jgi:hypothetical protein